MNRRLFLRASAAAAAAVSMPTLIPRQVLAAPGQAGANDRLQVGFIGLGGRARWILTKEALPGAGLVAVADCYLPRCQEAAQTVPGGEKWKKYQYYREMLEKEKLDAVFVETTTHARVLTCIHALQAGCDVYAEKPLTLTIAEGRPLIQAVRKYKREPRPDWLEAWRRGRTGYAIVDAGMRELWTTGWMHNRVRMIVASLLTKNLRQPWLEGARWFWDTLVDADLANNALGWQWTAGCGADAAPFFRVFNPTLQAERFDPDGAYIRRWLPELAARGSDHGAYLQPVLDFRESRAAALAAYARIKRRD